MYTKLFSSLLNSSIWVAGDVPTRILWITLLALADRKGYVYASKIGLADRAKLSQADCEQALQVLVSPDPESSDLLRNPENLGRRLEEIEGGWFVINYAFYRGLKDADERRAQNREAKQRQRLSATVSSGQHPSIDVSHSEAEAEAEAAPESEAYAESQS